MNSPISLENSESVALLNPELYAEFALPFQTGDLRSHALFCLQISNPLQKTIAVQALWDSLQAQRVRIQNANLPEIDLNKDLPGRPEKPELVPPLAVKRRAMNTVEGRSALLHALAHIEFNAINLALDAVWRFNGMPDAYYYDWMQVAKEEAYHYSLLVQHLQQFGYEYGAFSAHNSLWELAERTQADVLARMALVPRTMEARGLDACPALRAKLAQAGDMGAAAILDVILRDEIGHVGIGNTWFAYLCEQRQREPITSYAELAEQFRAPQMRGPFNIDARKAAGFTQAELDILLA
jgi:uncharacterized ferritin-like protein (DUF455 family)